MWEKSEMLCETEKLRSSSNNLTFLISPMIHEGNKRGIWDPEFNSSDTGIIISLPKGRKSRLLFN